MNSAEVNLEVVQSSLTRNHRFGDFDLGYHVISQPTFVAAVTAVSTIFVSSAGSNAFLPVISEMRRPKDYNKAVYVCSMLHHLPLAVSICCRGFFNEH